MCCDDYPTNDTGPENVISTPELFRKVTKPVPHKSLFGCDFQQQELKYVEDRFKRRRAFLNYKERLENMSRALALTTGSSVQLIIRKPEKKSTKPPNSVQEYDMKFKGIGPELWWTKGATNKKGSPKSESSSTPAPSTIPRPAAQRPLVTTVKPLTNSMTGLNPEEESDIYHELPQNFQLHKRRRHITRKNLGYDKTTDTYGFIEDRHSRKRAYHAYKTELNDISQVICLTTGFSVGWRIKKPVTKGRLSLEEKYFQGSLGLKFKTVKSASSTVIKDEADSEGLFCPSRKGLAWTKGECSDSLSEDCQHEEDALDEEQVLDENEPPAKKRKISDKPIKKKIFKTEQENLAEPLPPKQEDTDNSGLVLVPVVFETSRDHKANNIIESSEWKKEKAADSDQDLEDGEESEDSTIENKHSPVSLSWCEEREKNSLEAVDGGQITMDNDSNIVITALNGAARVVCDRCGYLAASPIDLKSHKESKHEGIRYPCDECDYIAKLPSYLSKHKRSRHSDC